MKNIYAYCVFFLFCGTSAFGQLSRGSFLEKIDNANASAKFSVQVEVDSPNRVYADGDILVPTVTSSQDGFLYLFYRDADAQVSVLFPNQYEHDNRIQQGKPVTLRKQTTPERIGYQIKIGAPFGNELLKVVVSKERLPFFNGMAFAKFNIAPNVLGVQVNDNDGNAIAGAMEQIATTDWAEHEINIRTVKSRISNEDDDPPPPLEPETAKMYLILAADISSADSVGGVVASDTYNLRKLIENNIAAERLNILDLQDRRRGNHLTKEDILLDIRNLNVNPNDTIFFFYSGHGAYDSTAYQYFALASQEQILRSEILDAMKNKHARLSILISDCCYNQADLKVKHTRPMEFSQPRGEQPRGEMKKLIPLVEKLFFEAKGVVDITASEKGTYGFIYPSEARVENGINKGSVFTWNLRKVLTTEMYASKNWEQIFNFVRDETNKDFQQVFAQPIQEGRMPQKELKPHAFSLP